MFGAWQMGGAEHGREGNSLVFRQADLDDIFFAHMASRFELAPTSVDSKGLNPHAKTLADRYEYRAQLICQDSDFRPLLDKVLHLLASGNSPAKITKLIGIEEEVVRRIRHAHPDSIKNIKQHLATALAEASQVLTEELIARAHEIPAEHLGRALQSTYQGHQLYSGGYTARVEHRTVASPEDLQKMFDSLPSLEVTQIEDSKPNGSESV